METFTKPTERPDIGKFIGFDHILFWVGNAKQAASFYTTRFGFEYYAYQGLETGQRHVSTHVLKRNDIYLAFASSYGPYEHKDNEMGEHLLKHGDGIRDVAFTVEDCIKTYETATKRGAKSVRPPTELKDEHGTAIVASIQTYGDTIHTFVERKNFKGLFLPGFKEHFLKEAFNKSFPIPDLLYIDHIVGNQPENEMEPTAAWYEKYLDFHRFWSIDDSMIHTEFSSLRSVVVADFDEVIKMPINEPAKGKRKSQVQEFCDYYIGSGVQHVALRTENIITAVEDLRKRGIEFLEIPKSYYDNFRKALPHLSIDVKEDVDTLERLGILIDYDDKGYLLQLFTKPVEDRPTLFFEIIQRRNHYGFGAGNFKSLFKAIEDEQAKRGNLTAEEPDKFKVQC